ncbi:hypothetical protein ACOMHN_036378, partial [Nucella lapillus]
GTVMLTAAVGSLLGGWMTKQLNTPVNNLRLASSLSLCSTLICCSCIFIQCPLPPILNYPGQPNSSLACASQCQCGGLDEYLPVCDRDHKTYFSPCRAGCKGYINEARRGSSSVVSETDVNGCECEISMEESHQIDIHGFQVTAQSTFYVNCSCVAGQTTRAGVCDYTCSMLYVFLAAVGVVALLTSISALPKVVVLFRSVDVEDKPFALGISSFMVSLTGWILAPLLFGYLIDGTCELWDTTCEGQHRSCHVYNMESFRYYYYGAITASRVGALLAMVAALLLAQMTGALDRQPTEANIPGAPPESNAQTVPKGRKISLTESVSTMIMKKKLPTPSSHSLLTDLCPRLAESVTSMMLFGSPVPQPGATTHDLVPQVGSRHASVVYQSRGVGGEATRGEGKSLFPV